MKYEQCCMPGAGGRWLKCQFIGRQPQEILLIYYDRSLHIHTLIQNASQHPRVLEVGKELLRSSGPALSWGN